MHDVPIMGDVDDMEVDYADTLEATTLVMGGSDVAIMADVEDMEESTVGTITKMSNSNDIVIYIYVVFRVI